MMLLYGSISCVCAADAQLCCTRRWCLYCVRLLWTRLVD